MRHPRLLSGAVAALSVLAASALAQTPLIADFGKTVAVEGAAERPDPALDYKVVIDVTGVGQDGAAAPGLQMAARLANLLAESGVPASHRHIVVVLHGKATAAVLTPAAAAARGKGANPNARLIERLSAAGVSVRVCGQALTAAGIERAEMLPEVQVDLSAITTLTTLQLRGYALLSD